KMKRIRILFVFGALGGGGAQRQFGHLIQKLDKKKFEPIVLSIGPNKSEYELHIEQNPEEANLEGEKKIEEFSKFHLYRKLKEEHEIAFVQRQGPIETKIDTFRIYKKSC